MNYIPFTRSENSITLIYDGKSHVVSKGNSCFDLIVKAIKESRWSDVPDLVDRSKVILKNSDGKFQIIGEVVYINGEPAPDVISRKILKYTNEGLPYKPIVAFWEKLAKNPSFRARHGLFTFLENNGHPLTEDGCFLGYKRVTSDYKDVFTKTIDNSIGSKPSMNRHDISDDPTVTCAPGLHVANLEYAGKHYYNGSGNLICVKVDPEHVVAVPVDYNNQKMRVCQYLVVSDFVSEFDEKTLSHVTAR